MPPAQSTSTPGAYITMKGVVCMESPKAIVTVIRPNLTPEEYDKQMERIKAAAVRFLRAIEAKEAAKKQKEEITI